jgi:hypothetical protein
MYILEVFSLLSFLLIYPLESPLPYFPICVDRAIASSPPPLLPLIGRIALSWQLLSNEGTPLVPASSERPPPVPSSNGVPPLVPASNEIPPAFAASNERPPPVPASNEVPPLVPASTEMPHSFTASNERPPSVPASNKTLPPLMLAAAVRACRGLQVPRHQHAIPGRALGAAFSLACLCEETQPAPKFEFGV